MKRFVIPAAVLCLVLFGPRCVSADDWFTDWFHEDSESSRTEDKSGSRPLDDTATVQRKIWESEATGRMDVLTLKNGNRFAGLILGETRTQITLARYSGRVASPHTLRVSKSDIAGIERLRPERRASVEPQVRELLENTQLARQRAEIARWQEAEAAAWQQLADSAVAFQQTMEAVQRHNVSRRTSNYPSRSRNRTPQTIATRTAMSRRPSQLPRATQTARSMRTARRAAPVPRRRVRAAGKG